MIQQSMQYTVVCLWLFVDFAEVYEPGIPDDKANSSTAELLVTVMLPYPITESPQQGGLIRCKKLSHPLLDDDLLHLLDTHE